MDFGLLETKAYLDQQRRAYWYLLTDDKVNTYALQDPLDAIKFAYERLRPEVLDACAEKAPFMALRYASHRLTPGRLNACAKADAEGFKIFWNSLSSHKRLQYMERGVYPPSGDKT